MQTQWNWSVLSWWRHNGRRHLRSDQSLCVRTFELWVAWLAIGMWCNDYNCFYFFCACSWKHSNKNVACLSDLKSVLPPFLGKKWSLSQNGTFMEVILHGQQGFVFNPCDERQGFALNWMCELCGVPLSSIMWRVALVSTLVFFPLLLLAQLNLLNAQPEIWKSKNDSFELRQKHFLLSFFVCASLINIHV